MMPEAAPAADNDFGPIADVYDQLVAWAPYGQWVRALVGRLERHGLRKGARVLDAACGTGLSTIPWAEEGFRVVGADRSELMLERARRKAEIRRLAIQFVRQDLLHLNLPTSFDAAVCMHSGLDYILELDELAKAFRSLRAQLKGGGLLAFDKCLDESGFYRDGYTDSRRIPAGVVTFEYLWHRDRKLFEQRCTVLRDGAGARTEIVHYMRAVKAEDLVAMVREAGFEMLEAPRQFAVSDPGMGIFRAV